MDFNGIPLHPLVIHAVVVLTPLAALLAIGYAAVPRWRWALRWPLVVTAVLGAAVTYVAVLSGQDLDNRLGLSSPLLHKHETWAHRLQNAMWALSAAALLAWWMLPWRSPIGPGTDHPARARVLALPLTLVLVLAGLAVLICVYFTGDAGAHLVWQGTPK